MDCRFLLIFLFAFYDLAVGNLDVFKEHDFLGAFQELFILGPPAVDVVEQVPEVEEVLLVHEDAVFED